MTTDELLELCDAATPGPWWRTDPPWGDGTSVHAGPSDDPHTATKIICEFDPFDVQFSPRYDNVDSSDIVEFDHVTDDMAFIAAAREHFPACLRRLKEADNAIRLAFGEMIFLEEQCKFRPGGSCDRALQALKLYRAKYLAAAQPLSLDGKDGA